MEQVGQKDRLGGPPRDLPDQSRVGGRFAGKVGYQNRQPPKRQLATVAPQVEQVDAVVAQQVSFDGVRVLA